MTGHYDQGFHPTAQSVGHQIKLRHTSHIYNKKQRKGKKRKEQSIRDGMKNNEEGEAIKTRLALGRSLKHLQQRERSGEKHENITSPSGGTNEIDRLVVRVFWCRTHW